MKPSQPPRRARVARKLKRDISKSKRFFSEEKYHYTQNKKIEIELAGYKREIEARFKKSTMNSTYKFPKTSKLASKKSPVKSYILSK